MSGHIAKARPCAVALASAALTRVAWWGLRRSVPGGPQRWERTNHAGQRVTLLEGPAFVTGAAAATVVAAPPAALAALGAGALGAVDDLRQDTDRKGLRGHLQALRHGRVTTGAVKIAGLGAAGLVSAAWSDARADGADHGGRGPFGRAGATLLGGAVVAGAANLVNLFDLRPGRALKVTVLVAAPLALTGAGSATAAAAGGAALALLPEDLVGASMLGDTGANPAGALIGLALVERHRLAGRLVVLAVLTGLTLASEKVSFTTVIEATPVLRELDALGRPVGG